MVRFPTPPRGSAFLLGGLLVGTALILAVVLGGHVHFGSGGAPVVRIESAPAL